MEVVTLTKELNDHQFLKLLVMILYLLDKWTRDGYPTFDLKHFGIDIKLAKEVINILVTRELIHPVVSSRTFCQGVIIKNITESRRNDFCESEILTEKGMNLLSRYDIHHLLEEWK